MRYLSGVRIHDEYSILHLPLTTNMYSSLRSRKLIGASEVEETFRWLLAVVCSEKELRKQTLCHNGVILRGDSDLLVLGFRCRKSLKPMSNPPNQLKR